MSGPAAEPAEALQAAIENNSKLFKLIPHIYFQRLQHVEDQSLYYVNSLRQTRLEFDNINMAMLELHEQQQQMKLAKSKQEFIFSKVKAKKKFEDILNEGFVPFESETESNQREDSGQYVDKYYKQMKAFQAAMMNPTKIIQRLVKRHPRLLNRITDQHWQRLQNLHQQNVSVSAEFQKAKTNFNTAYHSLLATHIQAPDPKKDKKQFQSVQQVPKKQHINHNDTNFDFENFMTAYKLDPDEIPEEDILDEICAEEMG